MRILALVVTEDWPRRFRRDDGDSAIPLQDYEEGRVAYLGTSIDGTFLVASFPTIIQFGLYVEVLIEPDDPAERLQVAVKHERTTFWMHDFQLGAGSTRGDVGRVEAFIGPVSLKLDGPQRLQARVEAASVQLARPIRIERLS